MKTSLRLFTLYTFFLLGFSFQTSANDIQVLICEAGQNFGQAVARAQIAIEFGTTDMGAQETAMFENLENATRYVADVEASLPEPWATIRKDNQHASRIRILVDRLREKWPSIPLHQRVGEIQDIYKSYLESLRYTYNTGRPDAIQKKPNCDSKIMQLCYYFGIAKITSETAGDPERPTFVAQYQQQANSRMSGNIGAGLDLAMDPGARPFNGHSEKICCGFGLEESWNARPRFRSDTPTSVYLNYEIELKEIIRLANPSHICSTGQNQHCISSSYYYSQNRSWDKLDLQCFDDPRYSGLKKHLDDFMILVKPAPPWWYEKPGNPRTAKFVNFALAWGATRDGVAISASWVEPGTEDRPGPYFCPCNSQYKKINTLEARKQKLPEDPNLGISGGSIDIPNGVIYTYYSQISKAVKFEIKILGGQKGHPHIQSAGYYQHLADCVLSQIESIAVPCKCDETDMIDPSLSRSQNDPAPIQADGSDTPTNYPPPNNTMDGSDAPLNLTPKEKWLSEIEIKHFKFFGTNNDPEPPLGKRTYDKEFARNQTNYVYWELQVEAPPTSERIDFSYEVVWYNPDGTEKYRVDQDNYYPEGWEVAHYTGGYGNKNKLYRWQEGQYRIELFIEGKLAATDFFELSKGPVVTKRKEWLKSIEPVFLSVLEMDKDKKSINSDKNNAFEAAKTRYIGFELGIGCKPPTETMAFTLDVVCYKASGEELVRYSTDKTYPADKDVRYFIHGHGNSSPGEYYEAGEYYFEVYVEGQFMGKKEFRIY